MINGVKTVVNYFGVMVHIFKAIERLVDIAEDMGNEGCGEEKKKLVVKAVTKIYEGTNEFIDLPISVEKLEDIVGFLIDIVVGFKNAVGRFR